MEPGHQRLWDESAAGAEQRLGLAPGEGPQGEATLKGQGSRGVKETLVELMLRIPGLSAELIPSHPVFLQQVCQCGCGIN